MSSSYSTFVVMFLVFFVLFILRRKNRRKMLVSRILRMKEQKGVSEMLELAKTLLGKECLIYTFNDAQVTGVLREVRQDALLIEGKDSTEIVNLNFVVRLREYPLNKKGKKKSIVVD